jgi:hypothetical protein
MIIVLDWDEQAGPPGKVRAVRAFFYLSTEKKKKKRGHINFLGTAPLHASRVTYARVPRPHGHARTGDGTIRHDP